MPINPAIVAAGIQAVSSAANAAATSSMNRKTRKWNEKMYALQRVHALEDWRMQNDYNSPLAQMQRLRDAGLNPNLVYDNGATHSAAPVRSVNNESWRPQAPHFDGSGIANSLMNYYNIQLQEAQTDNLRTQQTIAIQDAANRVAESILNQKGKGIKNQQDQLTLEMASELRATTIEAAKEDLRRTQISNQVTLNQDERAAAMNAQNLQKGVQEILNLREQRAKTSDERRQIQEATKSIMKDQELKQLDIDLKEKGVQPGDPLWMRVISRIVEKYITAQDIFGDGKGPGSWLNKKKP